MSLRSSGLPTSTSLVRVVLLPQGFAQGAAQAVGIARPLQGVGVGQVFALARYGSFQRLACQPAQPTHGHQRQAQHRHAALHPFVAVVKQHLQPKHVARQFHVQPRIAFVQVGQLMRHHAFELITVQVFQRAHGYDDDGILRVPCGGEGVQRPIARQHHHLRHLGASGDAQLLHNVDQSLLGMADRRPHLARAQLLGQVHTALHQIVALDPGTAQHHQGDQAHIGGQKTGRVGDGGLRQGQRRGRYADQCRDPKNQSQRQVHPHHNCQHQEQKGP